MKTGYRTDNRRNRPATGASAGFSLIEVMVVLVVLLIGVFALLRLFPPGFLAIQRTAEQTAAQALSEQQINAAKEAVSIPESIISARYVDGVLTPDSTILPDDLGTAGTADVPSGDDPYYYSNVNKIRYIIGETFRIPVPSANAGKGYGSIYVLQNGPVYNKFDSDLNSTTPDSISVYGATMERIEASAGVSKTGVPDANLNLQNESQYAIDYDRGWIAFYPRRADASANRPNYRVFRMTFDYYTKANPVAIHTAIDAKYITLQIPDDTITPVGEQPIPVWYPIFRILPQQPNGLLPIPSPSGFLGMKRNSEDVSRAYRLISLTPVNGTSVTNPKFTDDPYEYAWYSEQQPNSANIGVLLFNPRGHDQLIDTASGPQALTARVDYMVFDNHILREERTVPNQAPYYIKLSVPFIQTNGDVLNDNTTYNGMFRTKDASPDMLIYNANTGDLIALLQGGKTFSPFVKTDFDPTSDPDENVFTINPKDSVIRFQEAFVNKYFTTNNSLQAPRLRIYYKAQKDWGMQVQKAHGHYVQADSPAAISYRSYYVTGTVQGDGTNSNNLRIYFPRSEAGKTVVLGEYWIQGTDSNGKTFTQRFNGEMYKISTSPTFEKLAGYGPFPYIDLNDQHKTEIANQHWTFTSVPTGRAVSNVQGVSIRSRIIWQDAQRWRRLDTETFLTPAAAR